MKTIGREDARATLFATARLLVFATALVPLIVLPGFFFPYVTVRAVFFRVVVELASAILLYVIIRRHITLNVRRDVVFWALAGWVGANALAAVFGAAPIRSIFGDHQRMGGVWFWVHLLAYYVVARTVLRPDDWWRYFRVAIGVATVIAGYGLVQYWFRPFEVGIAAIDSGVTIGNPGLLGVYLLANFALCVLLAARSGPSARVGYLALALLMVVGLVFSGNRSSVLGLLIGSGAALITYAIWTGSLRGWRGLLIVALFASAVALPFISRTQWARPVTSRVLLLQKLSAGVDSTRIIQWRAAMDGIRDRPLLGVGPENYQIIWSRYYHPEMYRVLGESSWDRAHNAYLEAFATAGVLGFLSLLAIWLALAWSGNQAARGRTGRDTSPAAAERTGVGEAIAMGFFVAYAFFLFFWFFDLNSTMLWIFLAAFIASRATGTALIEVGVPREKRWQSTMVVGLGAIALVSVLYIHGYKTLEMARTLDRAAVPNRPFHQTLADFESVFASPAPFTQQSFVMYAGFIRSLYPNFQAIRNDPASADLFDRAFVLAVKEFERQEVQDPHNIQVLMQHARVLMLGAYYYGNQRLYDSAIAKLQRTVVLAPSRVTTHLLLGAAYLNNRRPREALKVFEGAYAVYPPHGQTHGYLALAHAAEGNTREAGRWLESALEFKYLPDQSLVMQVALELADSGAPVEAAKLVQQYTLRSTDMAFVWAPHTGRGSLASHELAVLGSVLFASGGDSASASNLAAASKILCERHIPLVDLAKGYFRDSGSLPDCGQPWRDSYRAY